VNIIQAMQDPKVFAAHFRSGTWAAWTVFLLVLFGLPMTPDQLAVYRRHTGRTSAPTNPLHEAWLVCGRRAGKSFVLALIAVYLACFVDWRSFLGPGEIGTIMIIARDRRQARVIKRFVTGLLRTVPMLRRTIEGETQEIIELRNAINIEIHTASFRSTRGYTIVAALLDEVAFWEVDETSADPDVEVIAAIRPGMATVPGAMLLVASSPHARKGALWTAFSKHYGKNNDPVLVWQATTREMNPSVSQDFIDAALEADPVRNTAEYLAQFRTDVESFISREIAQGCVSQGIYERPPERSISYVGFVDPSNGAADSMTLAIGHNEANKQLITIDALREVRAPFSPEAVVGEFAALLKSYRIGRVTGDRVGGQWCVEQFSKFGIHYEAGAKVKSELYHDMLALLNSHRLDLLDNQRAFNQLIGLERRVGRSGARDSIDHSPNQHDDLINAIAGCASSLISKSSFNWDAMTGDMPDDPLGIESYRRMRYAMYLNSGGRVIL
jgi:hypothetical protein